MRLGVTGFAFQKPVSVAHGATGVFGRREQTPVQTQAQAKDQVSIRFGQGANTLDAKQRALAAVFGLNPADGALTLEKLRQGFVDKNWQLLAQVIVVTKEEADREVALMRAIDLGESFLTDLTNALRPACAQNEVFILNNETVMMFVAQSLGWDQDMQEQMDRPQYNRNTAAKLGLMDSDPTPQLIIAAMQGRTQEELRSLFALAA